MTDYRQLLAHSNPEMGKVDPVLANLLVAKALPALAHLDIPRYQEMVDGWAAGYKE